MPALLSLHGGVGPGEANEDDDRLALDNAFDFLAEPSRSPFAPTDTESKTERFQEQNGLKIDRIARPGGETERAINNRLTEKPPGAALGFELDGRIGGKIGGFGGAFAQPSRLAPRRPLTPKPPRPVSTVSRAFGPPIPKPKPGLGESLSKLMRPVFRAALQDRVGTNRTNEENDVARLKQAFGALGKLAEDPFDKPHGFITGGLDQATRDFQAENKLLEDGLFTPSGPTEARLDEAVTKALDATAPARQR